MFFRTEVETEKSILMKMRDNYNSYIENYVKSLNISKEGKKKVKEFLSDPVVYEIKEFLIKKRLSEIDKANVEIKNLSEKDIINLKLFGHISFQDFEIEWLKRNNLTISADLNDLFYESNKKIEAISNFNNILGKIHDELENSQKDIFFNINSLIGTKEYIMPELSSSFNNAIISQKFIDNFLNEENKTLSLPVSLLPFEEVKNIQNSNYYDINKSILILINKRYEEGDIYLTDKQKQNLLLLFVLNKNTIIPTKLLSDVSSNMSLDDFVAKVEGYHNKIILLDKSKLNEIMEEKIRILKNHYFKKDCEEVGIKDLLVEKEQFSKHIKFDKNLLEAFCPYLVNKEINTENFSLSVKNNSVLCTFLAVDEIKINKEDIFNILINISNVLQNENRREDSKIYAALKKNNQHNNLQILDISSGTSEQETFSDIVDRIVSAAVLRNKLLNINKVESLTGEKHKQKI